MINKNKWREEYFENHKYRYINDLKIIEDCCNKNGKGKATRILEVGSAPYHLTLYLKDLNYNITGLDINPQRFKRFIKDNKLNIIKCNIEKQRLPFKNNKFDLIIFNEVFEHIRYNHLEILEEFRRVLKHDGLLMLTTPNVFYLPRRIKYLFGYGFVNPYQQFIKLRELGHMGHLREYSIKEMREILKGVGFNITMHKCVSYYVPNPKLLGLFINFIGKCFWKLNRCQIILAKK